MTIDRDAQRESAYSQVRCILNELCPGTPVSHHTQLVEEMGIDSVLMMNLILRIEERFGVVLGGREMEAGVLETAGQLADFLAASSSLAHNTAKEEHGDA